MVRRLRCLRLWDGEVTTSFAERSKVDARQVRGKNHSLGNRREEGEKRMNKECCPGNCYKVWNRNDVHRRGKRGSGKGGGGSLDIETIFAGRAAVQERETYEQKVPRDGTAMRKGEAGKWRKCHSPTRVCAVYSFRLFHIETEVRCWQTVVDASSEPFWHDAYRRMME